MLVHAKTRSSTIFEQFGSYDYAPRLLSLFACSLSGQRSRMLMQKRPLFVNVPWLPTVSFFSRACALTIEHCYMKHSELQGEEKVPTMCTWIKRREGKKREGNDRKVRCTSFHALHSTPQ